MSVTVNVNNLSLVHKASMGITMATIPDVCKTPSPGGPVPIPYPNISRSGSLSKGSKKVKADGGNMIAVKGSEFSMSNGDEPGTVGGVKSGTFMKEAKWLTYSFDVKIEGKNASRLTDKMTCNHGNTVSLGGEIQQPIMPKRWDVSCILKILCKEDSDVVRKLRRLKVKETDTLIFDDPYYDGKKWTTKRFYAAGTAGGNTINIHRDTSCEDAAVTIYHEVLHTEQDPKVLDTFEKREYDAYYNTENWTIKRSLPSQGPGLRTTDAKGGIVASWDGAVEYVHKHYPVPPKTTGPPPPRPVGKTATGQTILSDGNIRSPKKGDTFPASKPTNKPREKEISPDKWNCP